MPETKAAAKLVPDARQSPPPTQAPGTWTPGATMPWVRWLGPQLLLRSGMPSTSWAPTARTPGTEAGSASHAQP